MPKKKPSNKAPKKIKLDKKKLKKLFDNLSPHEKENDNSEISRNSKKPLKSTAQGNEFQDFIEIEDSLPSLERIALRQNGPVFIDGIPQRPSAVSESTSSEDPFKYTTGANGNANEPKYLSSPEHITSNIERTDFNKIGRDFNQGFSPVNQESMFIESMEPKIESPMQEKRWEIDRQDFEREKRKNPFERDEAKYDKYTPDLPKSR